MKKLMIAAAIVCAAAISQAANVNWSFNFSSSANVFGVDSALVSGNDNGTYAAATTGASEYLKKGTWTAILEIYSADQTTKYGASDSFDLSFKSSGSKLNNMGVTVAIDESVAMGSQIYYKLLIDGTQNSVTALGKQATYDYSAATVSGTIEGAATSATMGATVLDPLTPATWTVAGITSETPEPTPEPTSAMLMLLGMAGLALRRKQK